MNPHQYVGLDKTSHLGGQLAHNTSEKIIN